MTEQRIYDLDDEQTCIEYIHELYGACCTRGVTEAEFDAAYNQIFTIAMKCHPDNIATVGDICESKLYDLNMRKESMLKYDMFGKEDPASEPQKHIDHRNHDSTWGNCCIECGAARGAAEVTEQPAPYHAGGRTVACVWECPECFTIQWFHKKVDDE